MLKRPWKVSYWQRYPSWDKKSCPSVVDSEGEVVCDIPQFVDHPGVYDERADLIAHAIVDAINTKGVPYGYDSD